MSDTICARRAVSSGNLKTKALEIVFVESEQAMQPAFDEVLATWDDAPTKHDTKAMKTNKVRQRRVSQRLWGGFHMSVKNTADTFI